MKPKKILTRISKAIPEFLRKEASLLEYGVNERSITHKLAEHLQSAFKRWHVDCEYNRRGYEQKKLPKPDDTSTGNTDGQTIFPDIIVHRRGEQRNLLVIEVKKSTNGAVENDIHKLTALTAPDGDFAYVCGLHLVIDCEHHQLTDAEVFTDGGRNQDLTRFFLDKL